MKELEYDSGFSLLYFVNSFSLIECNIFPFTEISPESGVSIPESIFKKVDLPEPEGPISVTMEELGISNSNPLRTSVLIFPI